MLEKGTELSRLAMSGECKADVAFEGSVLLESEPVDAMLGRRPPRDGPGLFLFGQS